MKRGYLKWPYAVLAAGMGLNAVAIYASLIRQMSWFKLMLFWFGVAAMAVFLLHHIFARVPTFRGGKSVSQYKPSQRFFYAVVLLAALAGAVKFTQFTRQAWQSPAAYWQLVEENSETPNRFLLRWEFGNQRYEQTLRLIEIQLVELGSAALHENGFVDISCQLDSLPLTAARAGPEGILHFRPTASFDLPPLSTAAVTLDLKFRQRFAIYEMAVAYQVLPPSAQGEAADVATLTSTTGRYVWVESSHAELLDFAQLAQAAQRASLHTRDAVIGALGRSRHAQAWKALQQLLQVNDPRVQGAACQALTYLGDPRATAALIQLVKRNKNPQAVHALATIAEPAGVDFLIKLLNDPREDSYLRVAVAGMMGETKLQAAIPTLVALVKDQSENADLALQREALAALANLDRNLATQTALAVTQPAPQPRQIRLCLENLAELKHEAILPLLADWLGNWRQYDLDADDVQTMLSYVVSGDHRDMVGVVMEALLREPTSEVQSRFVAALTALAGNNFGQIEFPEISISAQETNRRVVNAWQRWWGRARNQATYTEQISPRPAGNKI